MFNSILFLNLLICVIKAGKIGYENDSLVMVHALFRHGERTTEAFYPTDPYINETFYPIGIGGLTNRGKNQEYKLGKYLRQRYDKYLGKFYSNEDVQILSTGFMRTRMSALLVAAGLFPPSQEQIWNEHIPWIPIPIDYKPYEIDDLLNSGNCAKRKEVLKQQHLNEEVKKVFLMPHEYLMQYLEKHSGKVMKTLGDVSELYLILKTEDDTNFTLPNWTKSIYPEPIYSAASKVYSYYNFNPEIKKINSGYFLKKILDDFDLKINGSGNVRKMNLYCGHESTLGQLLDALEMYTHVPEYGSVILFELHKNEINDNYTIKILYKRGVGELTNMEEIIFPGCEDDCTVTKLRNLLKNILPDIPYNEACKI